ncbi:hypothetical protein LCGC14_2976460, partial [marine sediment metagenome]
MSKSLQKVIERAIKWNKEHKERRKEICQKWIQNNPEKVKTNKIKQNAKRTPEYYKNYNERTFRFKEKRITLKEKIRLGACFLCKKNIEEREIKRTHLHHVKYNPD